MLAKKIYLLIDYRGMFYSSTREVAGSMNVLTVKTLLEAEGYEVFVKRFADIDFRSEDYHSARVLYQSSEDPNLRYKDYIEDVLLGLQLAGARLIPSFMHFRAHHNKVFMEILRDLGNLPEIQSIGSRKYGALEELERDIDSICYPVVVKPGAGSRSEGIALCGDRDALIGASRKISRSFSSVNFRGWFRGFLSGEKYKSISSYRGKFIVQNYIEGLCGDYKVLVYADRYYVLRRMNRDNDFRASGGGRLSYPITTPSVVLGYAEKVFAHFKVPFASLDIAVRHDIPFLLEFQFVSFGQYALEKSDHYYTKEGSVWVRIDDKSDLEETFVYAVATFLKIDES